VPPTGPAAPALGIRRILVPLDFSEHALKALRYATALARQFGASLLLVHVTEPIVYPSDFGYAPLPPNALEENFQRDAQERMQVVVASIQQEGIEARVLLRVGRPYHEIVTAASECGADLIIVTTHGYTGLTHVLLGSTAERVVRHARCPVLVVRDVEAEFVR